MRVDEEKSCFKEGQNLVSIELSLFLEEAHESRQIIEKTSVSHRNRRVDCFVFYTILVEAFLTFFISFKLPPNYISEDAVVVVAAADNEAAGKRKGVDRMVVVPPLVSFKKKLNSRESTNEFLFDLIAIYAVLST